MTHWLLLPIVAILGVLAGGAVKNGKLPSRIALACIFSYATISPFNLPYYSYLIYAAILYLGMAPGHGQPIGFLIQSHLLGHKKVRHQYDRLSVYGDLEWWQWEKLRFKPYISLHIRGWLHLNPAFALSLPLAAWIALKMPSVKYMNEWRWWEALKYGIAYGVVLAISYI